MGEAMALLIESDYDMMPREVHSDTFLETPGLWGDLLAPRWGFRMVPRRSGRYGGRGVLCWHRHTTLPRREMKEDRESPRDLLLPWRWALVAICGLSLAAWVSLWLIVKLIIHVLQAVGINV
jgi:hypothetical protein